MKMAQLVFRVICALILVLAIVQVAFVHPARSAEELPAPSPTPATAEPAAPPAPEAGSDAERESPKDASAAAIAQELEGKKLAIESKEQELAEEERRLKER